MSSRGRMRDDPLLNYETWAVRLWLVSNEQTDHYWRGAALGACQGAASSEAAKQELAERLKDELLGEAPDLGASIYADLLGSALDEIDWGEVARHWITAAWSEGA